MRKRISGSMVAGLVVVAGLSGCSKPDPENGDRVDLVAPPPPPPAPGFYLALDLTPQAVAKLKASHTKVEVRAHYYDDKAATDAQRDIGVENIAVAPADLVQLSSPAPSGYFFHVVITGKAFVPKVDMSTSSTTVVVTASAPKAGLDCAVYRATLVKARKAPGELSCDLTSGEEVSS